LLHALELEWDDTLAPYREVSPEDRLVLRAQLERKINSPLNSSMGRLFDAVAALSGVRQHVTYEAQAAIEFEALDDPKENAAYPFEYAAGLVDPRAAVVALLADVNAKVSVGRISARFHNGLAEMVREVCHKLRADTGVSQVVLSGGVWQNVTLLTKTVPLLEKDGFTVLVHRQVPANDGGLALGQAAIAAWKMKVGG
jgi:hydrogenase maturation protein HypF